MFLDIRQEGREVKMPRKYKLDLIDDAILDFIAIYRDKYGIAPTAKEVGVRVRLSYEAANNRINNLVSSGHLTGKVSDSGRRVARSLRVVEHES
jgi:hypothetical protein